MLQVGIFTGYFPYGLEETARKIRALGFDTHIPKWHERVTLE